MSGMAEVLAGHTSVSYEPDYDGRGNNGIWCDQCGEGEDSPEGCEDAWLAKHQAAMLTAAGFGDLNRAAQLGALMAYDAIEESALTEAKAQAWGEGMEAMYAATSSEWPPIPEANPYRAAAVRGEG